MDNIIKRIVIVGGGTAGWLVAGVIAAEHPAATGVEVTLIESPDITAVGVGEGTWPTMRSTLQKMGISETELVRECDVAFKQASKFVKWTTGEDDDEYYHPFTLPERYTEINLANSWQTFRDKISFADAVSFQSHICHRHMGPKQITTPEFAGVANYAYHLDAAKFATFLGKHCREKLGVKYIRDNVTKVNPAENGDILSLATQNAGDVEGDLFIDCTGLASILLGKHYQIPFISTRNVLFNDAAFAAQVAYPDPECDIASNTISTAQTAGWIWDIGLPSRRGVGHVYSSSHISDDLAEKELRDYFAKDIGRKKADAVDLKKIKFNPGHREVFWHKNCVGVGLSAGFVEPLEASAIILIEISSRIISEQLPETRKAMDVVARRFNAKLTTHWKNIVDFLKLHYVLSKRTDSQYWIDHRNPESVPQSLQDLLEIWSYQTPWFYDEHLRDEMFPSASFQYILYGMGFETKTRLARKSIAAEIQQSEYSFQENSRKTREFLKGLPTHRDLINKIKEYGLQKI